jgi:hypothetical protein
VIIFVGDFTRKAEKEDIFKPTVEKKSLNEIVIIMELRVMNFAMSKNLSRVQCSHITAFINALELSWWEGTQSS